MEDLNYSCDVDEADDEKNDLTSKIKKLTSPKRLFKS